MVCPDCGGAGVLEAKVDGFPDWDYCETCSGNGVVDSYKLDGVTLTNTQLDLEKLK